MWNLLGEKGSLHLLSLFSYLQLICNSLKCGFNATTLLSNYGKGRPETWLPNAPRTHSWCRRPLSFWSWHPLSWLLFHLSHDPSSVSFEFIHLSCLWTPESHRACSWFSSLFTILSSCQILSPIAQLPLKMLLIPKSVTPAQPLY